MGMQGIIEKTYYKCIRVGVGVREILEKWVGEILEKM
jgi:hypothetical protein